MRKVPLLFYGCTCITPSTMTHESRLFNPMTESILCSCKPKIAVRFKKPGEAADVL